MDENQTLPVSGETVEYMPMRFHKFLIYFSLFFGALLSLSNALSYFTGSQYIKQGVSPEQVYTVFPSVKTLDMLFGFICLAQAVYSLYTRQRLAHLKTNGPAHFKALIIIGMLMTIAYLLMVSSAMEIPVKQFVNTQLLSSLLSSLVYLFVSWIYYGKRRALFVN